MRRRDVLALAAALPALVAAVPETLPLVRTRFVEVGDDLVAEFSLPDVLPQSDAAAMAAVDSGFATRLEFELILRAEGRQKPVLSIVHDVRLSWDPWNRRYLVTSRAQRSSRTYATRDAAIRRATAIRANLGPTAALSRGESTVYFLHVVAHRNPHEGTPRPDSGARGEDRDLSVFSRWVSVFLGPPPRAEFTIERRSNAFYLVPR